MKPDNVVTPFTKLVERLRKGSFGIRRFAELAGMLPTRYLDVAQGRDDLTEQEAREKCRELNAAQSTAAPAAPVGEKEKKLPDETMSARDRKLYAAIGPVLPAASDTAGAWAGHAAGDHEISTSGGQQRAPLPPGTDKHGELYASVQPEMTPTLCRVVKRVGVNLELAVAVHRTGDNEDVAQIALAISSFLNHAGDVHAAANEKQTRIKYQNIVYELCNLVDRLSGKQVTRGEGATIDNVLERLEHEMERIKRFDPENHHNAAKCPHCTENGRFVLVESTQHAASARAAEAMEFVKEYPHLIAQWYVYDGRGVNADFATDPVGTILAAKAAQSNRPTLEESNAAMRQAVAAGSAKQKQQRDST